MRTRTLKTLAALAVSGALLAGCAAGPNYRRPPVATPERMPGQARGQAPGQVPGQAPGQPGQAEATSLADRAWWDIFQDEALKGLIDEALRNGYDVRIAAWRVEEARANAGIGRSEFFPRIQAEGGWSRSRRPLGSTLGSAPVNLYDVNLGLTWEIDLWGRIRRLNEAALARYLATEEARRGVLLSLVSEVATSYFDLRLLDLQLEIARRTAGAFQETYDLFNRRLEGGAASALETASAGASLASTAASIPDLERQIAAQENRISFLLGRPPGTISRGAGLTDQLLPPEIPSGLPSDLLERRPDLREAEQRLVAANAEVGVATADLFPTLSLTGAFGGVARQVSDLFGDGRTWSAGGGILSPVFQGRRLKNQKRAAVARWEEARSQYEQSVTNAFHEVSTALVAYQKLAEVEEEQARSVASYREAVGLSNSRYVAGLADYLEVLQAQQQLFPAENALARTRFERLETLVELYRALGGGWTIGGPEWSRPASQDDPRPTASRTR